MSLKPMGNAEILMELIEKAIKDMKMIQKEVAATLPKQKRQASPTAKIVDPRTGKPFTTKKQSPRRIKPRPRMEAAL